MIFHVHLMDSLTGEVAIRKEEWDYGWPDDETINGIVFQYEKNNYSCDCNRLPFFCRTKGLPEPDQTVCGEPRILAKLMLDDRVLFSDWIEDETERLAYGRRVADEQARQIAEWDAET